jgi:hypothetical protein
MQHKSRTTVLMTRQDILHLLLLGIICTTSVVSSNLFLYFLSSSAYPTAQVLLPHNSDTIRKKNNFPKHDTRKIILSGVYGSVTNLNGFWIEWLNFLTLLVQSFLITMNYNNSKSIFSRTLLPSLPWTRLILILILVLVLVLRLTSDLRLNFLYSLEADP